MPAVSSPARAGPLGTRPRRPGGDGPLEGLTVHKDVEPLVEERDEAAHLCGVVQRLLVRPGDIGNNAIASGGRPIGRLSLVGTVGAGAAGGEFRADVVTWQVV